METGPGQLSPDNNNSPVLSSSLIIWSNELTDILFTKYHNVSSSHFLPTSHLQPRTESLAHPVSVPGQGTGSESSLSHSTPPQTLSVLSTFPRVWSPSYGEKYTAPTARPILLIHSQECIFLSESTHSILVLWPLNFLGSEQTIVQILGRKILQKRRKFSRQNDWIVFLEWRTKRSVGCSDNDQPSARVIHTVHRVTITSINGDTSLLILSSSFLQLLSLNYSHSRHTPLLPHFIFCQGGVVWLPVSNFYNSLSDKSLFHVQIFITDCDNSSASPPHVGDSNYVLKTSPQSPATLIPSKFLLSVFYNILSIFIRKNPISAQWCRFMDY